MNQKKPIIDLVAGARPNFMKLAPVVRALDKDAGLSYRIVHTGQHYDPGMNDIFFEELGIPAPDIHLGVGSGTHGAQTARILEGYEKHLLASRPDGTVVFGDVNSTVACALAASKLNIPVVHVEAGLRSFDRTMPEEINRIMTDAIADLLLVSEPSGEKNLKREGVASEKIKLVGNVMIDTLMKELPLARELKTRDRFGLANEPYGLLTMHRPSNVDDDDSLRDLLTLFQTLSDTLPLIFPMHPRTQKAATDIGMMALLEKSSNLHIAKPLSYRENLSLMASAKLVLTDSGGMQEESASLGVPCLTMRPNTERPVTVTLGTSRLVGNDPEQIADGFKQIIEGRWHDKKEIPLWDGRTGERVVQELKGLVC